jgi:hypothetical protein
MSSVLSASTISDMFSSLTYDGNIRVGYQNHETELNRANEIATGIKLHVETAGYEHLQLGLTLNSSYGNGKTGFEGVPFFDVNNENYAIISEAYLKARFSNTELILGRQTIDTPFADSDDIGMVPNTFEAYTLVNKDIQDTTLFFSQVQKMSGVDSDDAGQFNTLNGSKGVQIFGLTYEGISHTALNGWFYNVEGEGQVSYFDASYETETENYTYGAIAQYVLQNYEVGEDSKIYGVAASFGVKNIGLTTTLAYNKTYGRAAENFFGGGPFVTNAEHNTLKEAGIDGNTVLLTLEWDASVVGVEGLSFALNVDGHHGDRQHAHEYDFTVDYGYNDSLNFTAIYSDVDDKTDSFKNLRIFANYAF